MRKAITIAFLGMAFVGLFVNVFADDSETGQTEITWLSNFAKDAPAVSVDGVWHSPDWGVLILNQREGEPEVIGKGGGYSINGIVSSNRAYLVFSDQGTTYYSAVLVLQDPNKLEGVYSKGLMKEKEKGKAMSLTKR